MRTPKRISACLQVISLGLCALCGFTVHGAPQGVASIPSLVSSADVIVIGTVTSVQEPNAVSAGRLVLAVIDVFKGNYSGVLTLSYEAQDTGAEQTMIGERVLAFGKASSDGQSYTLLPMSSGPGALLRDQVLDVGVPAVIPAIAIGAQDTPLQKVIKELGMVHIGSPTSAAAPYLLSLTFAKVEPDVTTAVYTAIKNSGSKGSSLGVAGLVEMGSISGLQAADSLDVQNHPELSSIVSSIEASFNDTSQASLQILTRWLGPSMPAVKRESAAGALARIHTPDAVLQLGSVLNDSDFEVRWRVIGGLAMFANNVPVGAVSPAPGDWPFRTPDTIKFSASDRNLIKANEDNYMTFWRQWWAKNQGAIQILAATQAR